MTYFIPGVDIQGDRALVGTADAGIVSCTIPRGDTRCRGPLVAQLYPDMVDVNLGSFLSWCLGICRGILGVLGQGGICQGLCVRG